MKPTLPIDASEQARTPNYHLPALSEGPGPWRYRGTCVGKPQAWWFADNSDRLSQKRAIAVCEYCPVAINCLEFALANNERFGIWGGKTERERRKLLKTDWEAGLAKQRLRLGVA